MKRISGFIHLTCIYYKLDIFCCHSVLVHVIVIELYLMIKTCNSSAQETYSMKSLTPAEWDRVFRSMTTDDDLFAKYYRLVNI